MGHGKRVCDGDADLEDFAHGQGAFAKALRQRLAFEKLHDQKIDSVLRTDVVELADGRMVERGNGAGLAFEALLQLGRSRKMTGEDFYCDLAIEACVESGVDLAHSACAEGGADFVGAELCAGG